MKKFSILLMTFFMFLMFFSLGSVGQKQVRANSGEADLSWDKAVQTNTKSAYLEFARKYPHHTKAEEVIGLAQDFRITLAAKAPAKLDVKSLEGKMLTFFFVDVVAQWPDVVGSGNQKDIFAVFRGNKRSLLKAVLHWSWEGVYIDMEGSMRQINGGSFIHTEPLKKYPGHPVKFPSERGWFIYKFNKVGKIRLGLFFEGNADEVESFNMFGQVVDVSSVIPPDRTNDEEK